MDKEYREKLQAAEMRELAERAERAERERDRLREAMPSDEERDVLDSLYRATVEHVTGDGLFPVTRRVETALAKAREWLARLDAVRNGGG